MIRLVDFICTRPDYRGTVGVDFAMKVINLPGNVTVRYRKFMYLGKQRYI